MKEEFSKVSYVLYDPVNKVYARSNSLGWIDPSTTVKLRYAASWRNLEDLKFRLSREIEFAERVINSNKAELENIKSKVDKETYDLQYKTRGYRIYNLRVEIENEIKVLNRLKSYEIKKIKSTTVLEEV